MDQQVMIDCDWSPDGKKLATVADSGEARVWNITNPADFRVVPTVKAGYERVVAASWSPNGKTLALGSHEPRSGLSFWKSDTLECGRATLVESHFPPSDFRLIEWSSDGRGLFLATWGGFRVIEAMTGQAWSNNAGLYSYGETCAAANWMPGTHEIFGVAQVTGYLRLQWVPESSANGAIINSYRSPVPYASARVDIADDGSSWSVGTRHLETIGGQLFSFDAKSGIPKRPYVQLPSAVYHVELFPENREARRRRRSSRMDFGHVVVTDHQLGLSSNSGAGVLKETPSPGRCGSWGRTSGVMAVGTENGVYLWHPMAGNEIARIQETEKPVELIRWSPATAQINCTCLAHII